MIKSSKNNFYLWSNDTLKFLVIFIILVNFILNPLYANQTSATKSNLTTELNKKQILAGIELGNNFFKQFNKRFKNYKISSYCIGSFKSSGQNEYLLGIVNPDNGKGAYVILYHKKSDQYVAVNLSSFSLNVSNDTELPEVKCLSVMEAERLNNTIQETETASGKIKPINKYDIACISPYDSGYTYQCYSYRQRNKKFFSIGGWSV